MTTTTAPAVASERNAHLWANNVAAALNALGTTGHQWAVAAYDSDPREVQRAWRARLYSVTSGADLFVSTTWEPGRVVVSASLPVGRTEHRAVYGDKAPRVTYSPERPPAAVARDLARRLLPPYAAWRADQDARYEQERAYEAGRSALLGRLQAAAGPTAGVSPMQYGREPGLHASCDAYHGRISPVGDDRVHLDLTVPADAAVALLGFLRTLPASS